MKKAFKFIRSLAIEENGAEIIEYALIVAVICLGMLLALKPLADGGYFGDFLARLSSCLSGAGCT